jgi:hypothetical protein
LNEKRNAKKIKIKERGKRKKRVENYVGKLSAHTISMHEMLDVMRKLFFVW